VVHAQILSKKTNKVGLLDNPEFHLSINLMQQSPLEPGGSLSFVKEKNEKL